LAPALLKAAGAPGRKPREDKPARRLFNKIVRVRAKPTADDRAAWLRSRGVQPPPGEERFEYYFVLTYVPDLKWCRLAPMIASGVFAPSSKKKFARVIGRKRWILAPEGVGGEIDVSASRCAIVRFYTVQRVLDADREEWSIEEPGAMFDDGLEPPPPPPLVPSDDVPPPPPPPPPPPLPLSAASSSAYDNDDDADGDADADDNGVDDSDDDDASEA